MHAAEKETSAEEAVGVSLREHFEALISANEKLMVERCVRLELRVDAAKENVALALAAQKEAKDEIRSLVQMSLGVASLALTLGIYLLTKK